MQTIAQAQAQHPHLTQEEAEALAARAKVELTCAGINHHGLEAFLQDSEGLAGAFAAMEPESKAQVPSQPFGGW